MTDHPIPTRPVNEHEKVLRQKFYEAIAAQGEAMDKLAERLLMLELAIPGLYATALRITFGRDAKLAIGPGLYLTCAFWLVALLLTLLAIMPKTYRVDTKLLKQDSAKMTESLGLEDFFTESARYKRRLLIFASVAFFGGTLAAIFTMG